jgi:hypothetical protein
MAEIPFNAVKLGIVSAYVKCIIANYIKTFSGRALKLASPAGFGACGRRCPFFADAAV